ncbi:SusC/RagA family TonB-linked outer membrane protein [Pseudopedobacter beijingensis]|uniref:SusC/RagA family TonB-linked outer membrane protein n=1 Tax=Pseudopedobacter beijingensis TaxID=1207056 RepID=A0ABW4I7M2_9SPHI
MKPINLKRKKRKIHHLFMVMFLLLIPLLNLKAQQTITISGTVVDSNKEPLTGASVAIKGKTIGTRTDIDGKFSLQASPTDIIVFSFMGFVNQEIIASGIQNTIIILENLSTDLNEIVVVGYGTQKKVNLTGAVTSVNIAEQAESRPITNISSGLAGLSSGLYVNQATGRPNNNGASLLIRGQGTLNNAAPLVIIDGMEGNINDVNPQDVESVSVLKDASSSAIYGSRAANGVLLITTKQGSEGKTTINYNGYVSFAQPSNTIKSVFNYADYMEYYNEAAYNVDPAAQPPYSELKIAEWRVNTDKPYLYPNTNWSEEVFSTGVSNNHNLSFNTGSKTVKSFGSFSYLNNPGIVENSAYERFMARLNISAELKPWITLGMNLNGLKSDADMGSNYIGNLFSTIAHPGMVYRHPDGRYGAAENPEENQQPQSPLYSLNQFQGNINDNRISSRFYGIIKPFEGLSIEGSFNYRYSGTLEEETPFFADRWSFQSNTVTQIASGRTYVRNRSRSNTHYLGDIVARYEKKVLNKLQLGVLTGASQEKDNVKWFEAKKYDLQADNLSVINGATGESEATGTAADWVMHSYFGRLNLSWDDKYLLEANIRRDGSSRFNKNNRWGTFPSFSLGWRITEEEFMKNVSWVNMLKLRGSWGALGNNSVGNYEYQPVYNTDNYILNNAIAAGLAQTALSNAFISWETTYVANIGVDFSLAKTRLDGSVDIFDKDTRNILIDLPAPLLVGNATIPTQNAARVNNKGIEANLKWNDKIGNVKYFVGGNFTFIKNEVTRFKGDEQSISGTNLIQEGLPINVQYVLAVDRILQSDEDMLYVEKMIMDAPIDAGTGFKRNPFAAYGTPQKGDFLYKDLNGDGIIDDQDRYTVGYGRIPRTTYGISFGAEWKGFDFSCLLQGVSGLQVYWQDKFYQPFFNVGDVMNREIAENAWREGITNAQYPRLLTRTNVINSHPSDFWVQNKSYLRVKNLQLGYKFSDKVNKQLNTKQIRLFASMENFLTFTDYKGIDPEVNGTTYPTLKQVSFGLNITL